MKEYFLFIQITLALLMSSCNNNPNYVIVKSTVSKPIIDGQVDQLWERSSKTFVNDIFFGDAHFEGRNDISSEFKVLWDIDNIYFLFCITDDMRYSHKIPLNEFDKENWKPDDYDNITILFDLNNNKKIDYKKIDKDCKFGFTYNIDSVFTNTPNCKGLIFRQCEITDKYYMEIQIPWEILNFNPKNGKKIGFCVRIVDNDKRFVTPQTLDMLGGAETAIVWPEVTYFKNYYKCIGFLKLD